jgi:hypothetical protein
MYVARIFTYTLSLHFQRSGTKLESSSLSTNVVRGYFNILATYTQLTLLLNYNLIEETKYLNINMLLLISYIDNSVIIYKL